MSGEKSGFSVHPKLNELAATAICGNDILSSCLYVSGIAMIFAGVYAPLVLLLVGVLLYFFRFVYTEVVEALPINGGAYNCLLNGTSKPIAAVAGVMTVLSYIATACISAKVGVEYFARAFAQYFGHFDTNIAAIVLLGIFAVRAPLSYVVIALLVTAMGMVGNMVIDQRNIYYFMIYFIPTLFLVMGMIYQDYVFDFLYRVSSRTGIFKKQMHHLFSSIIRLRIVVFIHEVDRLYDVMKYVARNEVGRHVILITCDDGTAREKENNQIIAEVLPAIEKAGVYDHLDVTHETLDMPFGPEAVKAASKLYHVPINRILIGSVRHVHAFDYDDLGGVRIIH